MGWNDYKAYIPVAQRRADAMEQMDRLRRRGRVIMPIEPFKARAIASTFWGQAWCRHIECLSDFESRLDRGKTYVRNGSVCHLAISTGRIEAIVCGSELYEVAIDIDPLPARQWRQIKQQCAARIGSAVELLQGTFSESVMAILTDPRTGMFPHADDFRLDCNCPDFVRLCKHLAAVLYGVGVRLDTEPQLLFTLRGVDHLELLDAAGAAVAPVDTAADASLADMDLADVFGIDLAPSTPGPASTAKGRKTTGKKPRVTKKPATTKKRSTAKKPATAKKRSAAKKPSAAKKVAAAKKPAARRKG